ncbi:MFS general substrate transporter [Aureobasidium sp. EXF-8845]|nr:MFS general substrate transporter [Aureobasidium sp. EXF-8845]KAI4856343.1 MFS general substrate transporter [Aureobasidium sp. EXF-8846]
MSEHESKQIDIKDAAVTHHFEHPDDSQGEVLETRYAGLGRWLTVKTFWKAMLFCMVLNWAALNDGFQQQVPGNVIPMQAFINQMYDTRIDGKPAVSAKVVSYWQGFAEMSKTVGMFAGGWFADRFGRKKAMIGAIVILLGGSITEITAFSWQSWLGAAVLVRLGVGLAQSILITYISEIAPFQIRGFMIGAYQLCLGFGQLIAAIATQLVVVHQPNKWKPLIATEFAFTAILIIFIWFVPESHIYHSRKGQHEQAKRSMQKLYGYINGYDVEHEYRVIQHGIEAEMELASASRSSSFFEIFNSKNWRRTLAGCLGICSQWAAGAPIVFSYSTTAGAPKAALGFLLLWVICYGASAGPIGFVAAGETSTPRLRAQTTSFNLGCYGLGFVVFQWTVSYMISPDAANLGIKAVYVWAGLLVPFTILLWLYYPETYGRTYWELDELYERKIPAWKFKNTATSSDQSGRKNAALMSQGAKQEVKVIT